MAVAIVLGRIPMWWPKSPATFSAVNSMWLAGVTAMASGLAIALMGSAALVVVGAIAVALVFELLWWIPPSHRMFVSGRFEIRLPKDADEVFRYICDRPTVHANLPGVIRHAPVDGGPLRPGDRFSLVVRQRGQLMATTELIGEVGPGNRLVLSNDGGVTLTIKVEGALEGSKLTTDYVWRSGIAMALTGAWLPWRRRAVARRITAAQEASGQRLAARFS